MNYANLASEEALKKTVEAIKQRNISVFVVKNKKEALEKIKEIIPKGFSVMNGSSTTLQEIGFVDFLKAGKHEWNNLHEQILKEQDQQKKSVLMRQATAADYFLGSVNAIAQTGELVSADASGSRVGAYPFSANKVILVSGTNKITPSLSDAIQRVREYVYPLENERAKKVYGMGSFIGKMLIIEKEMFAQRITLILIKEQLGF